MKQSNVEENIPENVSVDYSGSGSDEENNNYLRPTVQGMVTFDKSHWFWNFESKTLK